MKKSKFEELLDQSEKHYANLVEKFKNGQKKNEKEKENEGNNLSSRADFS